MKILIYSPENKEYIFVIRNLDDARIPKNGSWMYNHRYGTKIVKESSGNYYFMVQNNRVACSSIYSPIGTLKSLCIESI